MFIAGVFTQKKENIRKIIGEKSINGILLICLYLVRRSNRKAKNQI